MAELVHYHRRWQEFFRIELKPRGYELVPLGLHQESLEILGLRQFRSSVYNCADFEGIRNAPLEIIAEAMLSGHEMGADYCQLIRNSERKPDVIAADGNNQILVASQLRMTFLYFRVNDNPVLPGEIKNY